MCLAKSCLPSKWHRNLATQRKKTEHMLLIRDGQRRRAHVLKSQPGRFPLQRSRHSRLQPLCLLLGQALPDVINFTRGEVEAAGLKINTIKWFTLSSGKTSATAQLARGTCTPPVNIDSFLFFFVIYLFKTLPQAQGDLKNSETA